MIAQGVDERMINHIIMIIIMIIIITIIIMPTARRK